ncbi:hypothetical protein ACWIGG_05210 [Micromonospora aurantiaca (nom. illeg.)]
MVVRTPRLPSPAIASSYETSRIARARTTRPVVRSNSTVSPSPDRRVRTPPNRFPTDATNSRTRGSSGASGTSHGSNASTATSIAGMSTSRTGDVIASTYSISDGRPNSAALSA